MSECGVQQSSFPEKLSEVIKSRMHIHDSNVYWLLNKEVMTPQLEKLEQATPELASAYTHAVNQLLLGKEGKKILSDVEQAMERTNYPGTLKDRMSEMNQAMMEKSRAYQPKLAGNVLSEIEVKYLDTERKKEMQNIVRSSTLCGPSFLPQATLASYVELYSLLDKIGAYSADIVATLFPTANDFADVKLKKTLSQQTDSLGASLAKILKISEDESVARLDLFQAEVRQSAMLLAGIEPRSVSQARASSQFR